MNDGYIFCDYIQSHVGTEGNGKTVSIKNNVSGSIRVKREIGCWSSSTEKVGDGICIYNFGEISSENSIEACVYYGYGIINESGNVVADGVMYFNTYKSSTGLGINTTRSNTSRGYQGSGSISYSEKYEYNDLQE